MANNYSTVTFLTLIPTAAINALHKLLLERFGYECAPSDQGTEPMTYIYSTDANSDIELDEEDIDGLTDKERDCHLMQLALEQRDLLTMEVVVQDILAGIPESEIQHVDVMASYVCDKARPGEHGGWSLRISRDRIQCKGTHGIFEEWDSETAHVLDLEKMCEALSGHPDAVTAQAVARISDYISNHPAVEYGEGEHPVVVTSPVDGFLAALKVAYPVFGEKLDHPQLRSILNGWNGKVEGGATWIELECVVGAATVPLTILGDLGLTGKQLSFNRWMADNYKTFFCTQAQ